MMKTAKAEEAEEKLRKAKKRSSDAAKQAIKVQLFLDMHFS